MEQKRLNKVLLIFIKFYPFINSLFVCTNLILHYFSTYNRCLDYFILNSPSFFILLYILSYVFKFCRYHRIFIHYLVLEWLLDFFDDLFRIPLNDKHLMYLQMIFFCVFLFTALYLYLNETGFKKFTNKHYR